MKTAQTHEKHILLKVAILSLMTYVCLGLASCTKDPSTPIIDATKMKITSASDFTGTDGDTTSFKFTALNDGGGVVDGATVSWTCDNMSNGSL